MAMPSDLDARGGLGMVAGAHKVTFSKGRQGSTLRSPWDGSIPIIATRTFGLDMQIAG
jgi:hypothetical protein